MGYDNWPPMDSTSSLTEAQRRTLRLSDSDYSGPLLPRRRQDWRKHAECNGMDVSIFFPDQPCKSAYAQALAICKTCEVLVECLDDADATEYRGDHYLFGVRGGETPKERGARRRGAIPRKVTCGTEAGYDKHRKAHEKPCAACTAAHARNAQRRVRARQMRQPQVARAFGWPDRASS